MSNFVIINGLEFETLLALSFEEKLKGLMGQKFPHPNMTFIYSSSCVNKYWMKLTPSPLDIIFCLGGEIVNIWKGEPFSTSMIGRDDQLSDLVVEFPYGTCKLNDIKIGDKIELKCNDQSLLKILLLKTGMLF